MPRWMFWVMGLLLAGVAGANPNADLPPLLDQAQLLGRTQKPIAGYRITDRFPHDPTAFTQGLVLRGEILYESTGLLNASRLTRSELVSGRLLSLHRLDGRIFGEGIALYGDYVYQATFSSPQGYLYRSDDLKPVRSIEFPVIGWGLTTFGEQLVLSDGSATLRFLDPVSVKTVRHLVVADAGEPLGSLNELEYVNGEILANLWRTDLIARIDPLNGEVLGWINLTGLNPLPVATHDRCVLNGIAWREATQRLIVAGKCWPELYEIELVSPIDSED
ncbi:MAG: glutaminyl-peptide cyclotransferase [Thiotrichales bacterium]